MATIERDIYLLQRRRVEPISIVYGSAVPIKLNLVDYTIPSNASIVFYAQCGQNPVYRCNGTASGNSAMFTQPEGFFQPGENVLQMEINGRLIPLALPVYCEERLSGAGSTATPEQVRPYVLQAQDAATDAQTAAGQAQSSAQNAQTSASQANTYKNQANTAAQTAQAAAQTAQNASVRTPYVGNNNHWFVFDAETNTYVDSGVNSVGATGPAATLISSTVQYKTSSSGTTIPTGTWSTSVPSVAQGQFLWTKVTQTFNTGSPVISYSVSRMGMDGSGSVVSVNSKSPDSSGNVTLTAEDVGARDNTWTPNAFEVNAAPYYVVYNGYNSWSNSVAYGIGDYTTYNGNIWKCLVSNTGITPAEGGYWTNVTVISELRGIASNVSMKRIFAGNYTLSAGEEHAFDLTDWVGSGYRIINAIATIGEYVLPYAFNGVVYTSIYRISPDTRTIYINVVEPQTWQNQPITFVVFVAPNGT